MPSAVAVSSAGNDPLRAARRKNEAADPTREIRVLQRLRDFGFEINKGQPITAIDKAAVIRKIDSAAEAVLFSADPGIRIDVSRRNWFEPQQCGEVKARQGGVDLIAPGDGDLSVVQVGGSRFKLTIIAGSCHMKGAVGDLYFPHAALYDSRLPGQLLNLRGAEFDPLVSGRPPVYIVR